MPSVTKITPFCKVCKDAGKSEKEYTSHFVKSEPGVKGKIVCPTLLSQECRFCKKTGHTVKFCQVLLKQKKDEERQNKRNFFEREYTNEDTKKNELKMIKKVQNVFTALQCETESESDSDDECCEQTCEIEKVSLSLDDNVPIATNFIRSYASVLTTKREEAKPEAKPEVKPEAKPEVKPKAKPKAKPEAKITSILNKNPYKLNGKSWIELELEYDSDCDIEDSESENKKEEMMYAW